MKAFRTDSGLNPISAPRVAIATAIALATLTFPALASAQPAVSKSFNPAIIGPGSTSELVFVIDNSAGSSPVTNLAFSDTLPAGVTLASPAVPTTSCQGAVLSAADEGSTITLTDGSVDPETTCTASVLVTSSTFGTHTNTSGDLTSSAGNSGPATADLTVDPERPGFSKSFAADPIQLGDTVTLTFALDNSASASNNFNLGFSDPLPSGLVVAGPSNTAGTCPAVDAGAVTADPGSDTISYFALGPLEAGSTCTFSVDVTAVESGPQVNRTDELSSTPGGPLQSSGLAVDAIEVAVDPFTLVKSFIDDPAPPSSTVTLRFTLYNFTRDPATNLAFTDDLDATLAGLEATGLPLNDVCGPGSQVSGTSMISLSDGSLEGGGSCSFEVPVQVPAGTAPGVYTNTTSTVTGDAGGVPTSGSPALDDLVVDVAPILNKTIAPDPAQAGDELTVEFVLENPNSEPLTGISFQDVYTDFIPGSNITPPVDGYCNGTGTTAMSATTILFSGIDLAAGASCTFSFLLQVPLAAGAGIYTNTTSELTALNAAEEPVTGRPASDEVAIAAAPALDKTFLADPVAPGDTVTLRFTLVHSESSTGTATDIEFTDDLSAVLAGLEAIDTPISDVCGSGSEISGTTVLTLTGGSLASNDSCTFDITLQVPAGAPPAAYPNTTSAVTATVDGLAVESAPATDKLDIVGLTGAKEFIDEPAVAGGSVLLRFTLTNNDPDFAATDISFTDNLDAALTGLAYNGAALDVCGPGSELTGTTTLTLTGGHLAAGSSCTFAVELDIPADTSAGEYANVSSQVTATVDGSPISIAPMTDSLSVIDPLTLEKAFTDDPAVAGGTVMLEFTLSNAHPSEPLIDLAFTDDLEAALSGLEAIDTPINACGGSLSGTSILTFTGGTLAADSSCTISVTLQIPPSGATTTNTTSQVTGTLDGVGVSGAPASDELIVNQVAFSKAFAGPAAATGSVELQFVIDNLSDTEGLSALTFLDDLDAVLPGLVATNTPLTDVCGAGSEIFGSSDLTLTDGNILPGESCSFSVSVAIPASAAPGSYFNTTSTLTAGGLFLADPATANLSIQPPPAFSKMFSPDTIAVDGVSTLTFQIDNSASTLTASALDFTDNLPTGLLVAATPNASSTCGSTLTASPGGSVISFSGGSVGAGAACTVSVDVTGSAEGTFDNLTTSLVSSNGDSGTAAATLDVVADDFVLTKSFRTQPVLPGGLVEMELNIVNGSDFALTDIALTDDFDAVVPGLVAEGLPQADPCGAGSQLSGNSIVSLTGGSLAAGDSCSIVVPVRVPASASAGAFPNTTSTATAQREGLAVEAPPASATLEVALPQFEKQIDPEATSTDSSVTVTVTIVNPDPANSLTNIEFTDDLDGFIAGATATNTPIGDACGTGSILEGTSSINLGGGRLPTGGSCTIEISVSIPADTAPGEYINVTSALDGDVGGNTLTTEPASATLTIVPPPAFSKSFSPDNMALEQTSTLVFVIDNSAGTLAADSLAFVDNLPAGLEVAPAPAVSNGCGGTLSAGAGATTIELAGGSVPAGSTCQIEVDVTTDQPEVFENVTEDLTSSLGNSGHAVATLAIDNDLDGVPGDIEDLAPSNGDGNNDGTPDRLQSHVASLPTSDGNTFMTLVLTQGCDELNNVAAVDPASQPPAPETLYFPYGLVEFEVPCESAVIDVVYHDIDGRAGSQYWKYGPVIPGDFGTAEWYEFSRQPAGAPTGATPGGNVWTLVLADNELGDDTGNDGVIVDQGGPVTELVAVPAFDTFMLTALLSLLMLLIALCHIFRTKFVRSEQL